MTDFIHTGFYRPTLTTVDDPHLKVIETDNGINWMIMFYVSNELIDVIDLEHPKGSVLARSVLNLLVQDEDGNQLGTVEERITHALNIFD